MLISIPTLIILIISAFFTSIIAGTIGMGGGVIFVGILASFVEITYVIPLHAALMAISNASRIVLFLKHITWRLVGFYSLGLLPGSLAGIYIFRLLPKDLIKLMIGIFILVAIFTPLKPGKTGLGEKVFIFVGLLAGFFGIFFGATGPITAPFYIRLGIIKENFIATKAACQILDHLVKIPLFGFMGVNALAYWDVIVYLSLAVILGTFIGKKLVSKLSDKAFLVIFKVILIVLAVRIIILQLVKLLG
jgi:uncharacterized membrane protein YfcA